MERAYDINLYDGHLIINENGKDILVDTGSPVTLSRDVDFQFMGESHQAFTNAGGQTVDDFGQVMGYPLDVLLGMDILSDLSVFVDYKQNQVIFSDEGFCHDGFSKLPMRKNVLGAISVQLTVKDRLMNFALDTGAKISYVDDKCTLSEVPVENRDDFSPYVGHYSTPIYDMQAMAGDTSFPVKFGNLPHGLSAPLKMMGLDGAIGYDLFAAFTVIMDFKQNTIFYK